MTTMDIFTPAGNAQSTRAVSFFGEIIARLRRYNSYRRTLIELDRLGDRELTDLGLSRHQVRSVAYREVYNG